MKFMRVFLVLMAFAVSGVTASAGLITNVTSSDLTRALINVTQLPTIGNLKTLNMTVTLLQKNVPFDLVFESPIGAPQNNSYTVNMTVQNNITGPANGYINGFDLKNLLGAPFVTPGWSGLLSPVTPSSPYFALQMVNGPNTYNIPDGWRFGGINGGGPGLVNGGSAMVTFIYQQKSGTLTPTGTTRLRMTANPEPGTLILGSLAMIPAFVALRRRRKTETDVVVAE